MAINIEAGKFYRTRDGRKVGPMERSDTPGWPWEVDGGKYDMSIATRWAWRESGSFKDSEDDTNPLHDGLCIISEWPAEPPSPVRSVTRTEIVPGIYGLVEVSRDSTVTEEGVSLWLPRNHRWSLAELRAASLVLGQLADALSSTESEDTA